MGLIKYTFMSTNVEKLIIVIYLYLIHPMTANHIDANSQYNCYVIIFKSKHSYPSAAHNSCGAYEYYI